uniref:Phage_integrase domain-containing protein n=1 Tax=Macrostomum lignano TaxID=282301 RepID=A0A1I8FWV1_9PLAT
IWAGLPVLDHEEVEEFLNSAIDPECSLRDLDAKELQNIKDTEASSKSPSTLATTRNHIERLKKFLREKKLPEDIERMPLRYVDSYLRLWYQTRMFSTGGSKCPVEAVQLYLAKFPPGVEALFPKPIKVRADSDVWYSAKQVLGKNTLNDMMKNISRRAGLQLEYTNHCVRASVVTYLAEAGHSVREIKTVTGHRTDAAVDRYVKRISEKRKQQISNSLTSALHGTVSETEATSSKRTWSSLRLQRLATSIKDRTLSQP